MMRTTEERSMIPRNLLVPLDGSPFAERAIPVAQKLAAQTGGNVTFMAARDDGPEREYAYLETVAGQHSPADVLFIQDRPAAPAISLLAHEDGARLICMTSHGRGSLRWAALGSVTEAVIRESRHPVLVVGRHCVLDVTPFETAIVAVDGSDTDDPVVPVAIEWSSELGLHVHLVQVVHPLDVLGATAPSKAVCDIAERMRDAGSTVDVVVLRSTLVGAAIADEAAAFSGPLVMMSSHGRTGVGRFALGSVAMQTVAMAPAPVLVVHRPGPGE
jgi:nucleotide-binding universal stress UspA family protein